MRLGVVALVLSPLAGCALVAGLGDFGPADETSGNGGAGASGSPTSVTTGTMASSGGGGNGTTTGTMTSTSTTGPSAGGGGQGNGGGGAGPGGAGGGPSCFDGKKNGNETDQDCGGIDCVPCKIDQMCMNGTDCETTKCGGMKCVCNDHLVISEVRSRGPGPGMTGSAADEFVEIYNATAVAVTLDSTWTIQSRNAGGAIYSTRWTGAGQSLPPYGHFLVVGSAYVEAPAGDAALSSGITDESSVRLMHDATVVDALCYCGDASGNCNAFMQGGYSCEGTPMTNPNGNGANDDASMERKAGGAQGNCVDTIDSSMDFVAITPAQPQDLASLPTPAP